MTVCTNHVALGHLVEDALPSAVSKALSNAKLLIPKVIELEDDRITLTAVDARVLAQVCHQILDAFGNQSLLAASG
jgi:hypothetical protein